MEKISANSILFKTLLLRGALLLLLALFFTNSIQTYHSSLTAYGIEFNACEEQESESEQEGKKEKEVDEFMHDLLKSLAVNTNDYSLNVKREDHLLSSSLDIQTPPPERS